MAQVNTRFVKVGLIGAGIQASRSPRLHEQEAKDSGFSCSYQLFDLERLGAGVEALPELLAAAEQQGFAGLNITHPCKQAVIPFLDSLSEDAAAIGAVNTVVFKDGKRIGHNTDCTGFAQSFRRGLGDVSLGNVVLLGAGGAGSAVAYAALQMGVEKLAIHDSENARVESLINRLSERFGENRTLMVSSLAESMSAADGLIQATPVGMLGHTGLPLPIELIRAGHWLAEIIYFPLETELLRKARTLGCRTLDGGGMAVFQAAEAFRLFIGVTPDYERMLRNFAAMS